MSEIGQNKIYKTSGTIHIFMEQILLFAIILIRHK